MPSSPEALADPTATPTAVPIAWQPYDLTVDVPSPPRSMATRMRLFEVSADAGIPAELLAPARTAAEAAGYAAGWASGVLSARLAAESDMYVARTLAEQVAQANRAEVAQAIGALTRGVHSLERQAVPAAEQIESLIVSSAFDIAEALVGAILRDDTTRGIHAVSRALALAPDGEPVVVSVSPADHAVVTALATDFGRLVEVVADPSLAPGDAFATCGATSIDARISTGLARVHQLLTTSVRS
jgi:flagellar assembly protein FliH